MISIMMIEGYGMPFFIFNSFCLFRGGLRVWNRILLWCLG